MEDKRKLELFENLIDYIAGAGEVQCIDTLKGIGMTKEEAKELEFFSNIYEAL